MSDGSRQSLGCYLDTLRNRPDDLRVVSRAIDPNGFQVTGLLERLEQQQRFPSVLFRNPLNLRGEPSDFQLLINLWATRERCAEMLGLPPERSGRDLGLRFAELMKGAVQPVVVSRDEAPVQAHVLEGDAASLWSLPAVRHFEKDRGAVLTMAHVMRAPDGDFYNVTFAKTFTEESQRGGVTIHTPDLKRMLSGWEKLGRPFPVVNVLGHHPAFWMSSLALTPYGTNEYATAGAFLGEPLRLVPSVTWGSDFLVPAEAEIVIEGEMVPGERVEVNPFGELSRLYQSEQPAPAIRVRAITYRDSAIMQDVYSAHREHWLLGLIPREGGLYRHLQSRHTTVGAVHLPFSGSGRLATYISLKKTDEGQPKQVALDALSHAPMLQIVVVVDDDIDVFNEEEVLWALNTYVDPSRDVDVVKNFGRMTDHTILGRTRILIDATRPTHVHFPERVRVPAASIESMNPDEWLDEILPNLATGAR